MVPEPSVSNRSKASRISCFCSSVRPEERPLPLSRRAEPTACGVAVEKKRKRSARGSGVERRRKVSVSTPTRRLRREKKKRALRPRTTAFDRRSRPLPTGPLSGDRRNCAKFDSRRAPRGAVASDARPSRARERRDRRGRARLAPVRSSVRVARARACRSTAPNIGQQRISRFKLQIEARGKRHSASSEGRARRGATARAASERAPARRVASKRNRARAVWARPRVARVARARTRSNGTEIRDAGRLVCADPGIVARVPNRDARARVDRARARAPRRACAVGHPRGRRTIVVVGCFDELRAETRVSVMGHGRLEALCVPCEKRRKPTMERVRVAF